MTNLNFRFVYKVNQLKKLDLIRNVFPIHDKNELKKLESIWYKNVTSYGFFSQIPIGIFRVYLDIQYTENYRKNII